MSPPVSRVTVLSFEPNIADQAALEAIFNRSGWSLWPGCTWKLKAAPTVRSALAALRRSTIPLAICGCDQQPGAWKEMLEQFALVADPPSLIVTSRLADDRLWVEALNLGVYDVLAKPFDSAEVIRTVSGAWLHWQGHRGVLPGAAEAMPATAARSRAPAKAS